LLNLKKEFENYTNNRQISNASEFASNNNLEFETISNGSNNLLNGLGKRTAAGVIEGSENGQDSNKRVKQ
jgi:hypothetical protein